MIKLLGATVFSMLFAIAIVSFAINFGIDNQSPINLANESSYSYLNTQLETKTDTFRLQANASADALSLAEISGDSDTVRTGGQFKGLTASFDALKHIANVFNKNIFGGDPNFGMFTTIFISFIVVVFGLYIWKTWKGGSPD